MLLFRFFRISETWTIFLLIFGILALACLNKCICIALRACDYQTCDCNTFQMLTQRRGRGERWWWHLDEQIKCLLISMKKITASKFLHLRWHTALQPSCPGLFLEPYLRSLHVNIEITTLSSSGMMIRGNDKICRIHLSDRAMIGIHSALASLSSPSTSSKQINQSILDNNRRTVGVTN